MHFAGVLLLFPIIAFSGCIVEKMNPTMQYEVALKVVGTDGLTLPSGTVDTVGMYLFNENGFVRMVSTGKSKNNLFLYEDGAELLFSYTKDEPLTLVVWGNLGRDSLSLPTLTKGEMLEDAFIQLRSKNGYDMATKDLFYSKIDFGVDEITVPLSGVSTRASTKNDPLHLSLCRMVASLKITLDYPDRLFGTDIASYRIVVQSPNNAFNFLGKLSGSEAKYAPISTKNTTGEEVSTPVFRLLPTGSGGGVTINVYRANTLLYTANKNSDGAPLQTVAGEQLNVTLNFDYPTVRVTTTVTPWGEVTQDTEF